MSQADAPGRDACCGSGAATCIFAQALKLHCGGLIGLQQALGVAQPDVHAMVGVAHERYASLTKLPWDAIVRELVDWKPHRRRTTPAP